MFKKIIVGVLCVMVVFSLVGCNLFKNKPNFLLDSVIVHIKAEFEQEFDNEEFTKEDFAWDNIDRISYKHLYSDMIVPNGWIIVYLIQHGENQVLDAIEHFKTLDFVKDSKVNDIGSWD